MVVIEAAAVDDIPQITNVEITTKLQSFPDLVEDVDIEYPTREYRWKTYFAGQSPVSAKPERIVFKAIADDKIIGYIAAQLTTRFGLDAEIQSFYILKEYQRKGIGLKLLKQIVDWLAGFDAQSLCVGIAPENPYKKFYLKLGGEYLNPHWIVWYSLEALHGK